jgi:hypothetical protein
MSTLGWLGEGALKVLGLLGRAVGMKPGPDVEPLSELERHRYAQPKTSEEWAVGKNVCTKCGYWSPERATLTHPPCPGKVPFELA